jgi:hypothetical protein
VYSSIVYLLHRELSSLYLQGNPISESKQYPAVAVNVIPSLVKLDGEVIIQRKKKYNESLHGYEGMFMETLKHHGNSAKVAATAIGASDNSKKIGATAILASQGTSTAVTTKEASSALSVASIHLHKGRSSAGSALERTISRVSEHFYDGSGLFDGNNNSGNISFGPPVPSLFPWRDPPQIMPRPWKGKHVVGNPLPRPTNNRRLSIESASSTSLSPRSISTKDKPTAKVNYSSPGKQSSPPSKQNTKSAGKSIQFAADDIIQYTCDVDLATPKRRESFKEFRKSLTATTILAARTRGLDPAANEEQWISPTLSRNPLTQAHTTEINKLMQGVGLPKSAKTETEEWNRRRAQQLQMQNKQRRGQQQVSVSDGKTRRKSVKANVSSPDNDNQFSGPQGDIPANIFFRQQLPLLPEEQNPTIQHDDDIVITDIDEVDPLEQHMLSIRDRMVRQSIERQHSSPLLVVDTDSHTQFTREEDTITMNMDTLTVTLEDAHSPPESPQRSYIFSTASVSGIELFSDNTTITAPYSNSVDDNNKKDSLASINSPAAKPLVDSLKLLKARKLNMLRSLEASAHGAPGSITK